MGSLYQFRYFGDGDSRNFPLNNKNYYGIFKEDDDNVDWIKEVIGNDEVIKKVGIQTLPGTKVYLNGNTKGITIGATGIIEFEAKNGAYITELGFDTKTLNEINLKNNKALKENDTGVLRDYCYLIMDVYTVGINTLMQEEESSSIDINNTEQTEVE